MAEVKPFDFSRLPKITRQDAQLLDALKVYLPRIGFSEELGRSIKRLVGTLLGTSFHFKEEKIRSLSRMEKPPALPSQGVYLVFGLEPVEEKGFLELDPFLAHVAIDRLLGGSGEPLTMVRPLTEIEEGVLSYIFLKILSEIFQRSGRAARVHFRLEGIQSSPEGILPREGVLLSYRLTVGERSGYARLVLPSPFLQKAILEPAAGASLGGVSERELQYYSARLANLGFLETSLWAEIGATTLKARELQTLKPGDVMLIEKSQARLQGRELQGTLSLRLGRGLSGGFRGHIVSSGNGPLQLKLEGMELEHPV